MPEAPLREIESLDEVERRVGELWSELAAQDKAVLRACKMNLIVVAAPGEDLPKLLEDLGKVTDVQPGRVIVVATADRHGASSLKPWIAAHCHLGPGGHPVCSEQVVLEVQGPAEALVPEALLRLLVSDMPVFVWWRTTLVGEPLLQPVLEMADRFIVNSAAEGTAAGALSILAWMTDHRGWRGNVGDLAWVRTDPWREIVASMFDGPQAREELARLSRVRVACRGVADACGSTGLYLAGWLASRLGWTVEGPTRARRADGAPVEITLGSCEASVPGRIASVHLETDQGATFQATRTRVDGPGVRVVALARHPRLRRVQALDDLALLHGELQRDARDPIFEAALRAGAALSGVPARR
jgi:glucose-6-phosphate dehydrogenase assembly protein OpcA